MNPFFAILIVAGACCVISAVSTVMVDGRNARWWVWVLAAPIVLPLAVVAAPVYLIGRYGTKQT